MCLRQCASIHVLADAQISITSTVLYVMLYRVMVAIEDPFDELGPDDINLGVLSEARAAPVNPSSDER